MPPSRPVVQRGPAARLQPLPCPAPKGTPQLLARKSLPESQGCQSGGTQECCPTEKENYHWDVIEGTVRHQQAKEMQNDCQALKNLHTAYRKNPDKFDEEPEVLLGDVDLEEDTMVSLGLG
ncbi:hypothetical protein PAXINDRAFT_17754 [Paxillus involutus ATCC 200175]|uniref:Uncharacterized protein n=1 Tax=Paxillus involutus ATCC 200175 TaxID=664439 RepID=A0A0C9SPQ1_PAXIN|nr:hypothetical protein PAXINDRAFT_17754 [Paxillus involutus ATCC 200175]